MSFRKTSRLLQAVLLLSVLALSACGFHLRTNATLPAAMQRVHLTVNGSSDFQRSLARTLRGSGATIEDESGPGIAELRVPTASFSNDTLSAGGYARVTEYAVHYRVDFSVVDSAGVALVEPQRIDMQREYSYDATNTVGNASQVQEIQRSLNDDMVQAIMFRLQAAAKHPLAAPAPAPSAH